jgi:hypothetical protein
MRANQAQIVIELFNLGGIVKASDWVSGSGRFIKKRATPVNAKEYTRPVYLDSLPAHVKGFFEQNPKVKKCIALDEDTIVLLNTFKKSL